MTKKYLDQISKLLIQEQMDIFNRMYPDGPDKSQLKWAITQVENTILGQNKRAQRLRDIEKEFEEYKKDNADKIATHVRAFDSLAKELAKVTKENERLSASKIDIDNAEIIERLDKLAALEAGGVDNWEWYDEAMSQENE